MVSGDNSFWELYNFDGNISTLESDSVLLLLCLTSKNSILLNVD